MSENETFDKVLAFLEKRNERTDEDKFQESVEARDKCPGANAVAVMTMPASAALYDHRTKTLISGDCLQLYGIFGSGNWGANIPFSSEYTKKIQELRKMDIEAILTAHDYYPCGRMYFGKEEIASALDACLAPFALIQKLIDEAPDADDEAICKRYNSQGKLPTLGVHVIKKYRETISGSL